MSRNTISQAEMRRRTKQAEILHTAAHTLRFFGKPELGDELSMLAMQVRDGDVLPAKTPDEDQ